MGIRQICFNFVIAIFLLATIGVLLFGIVRKVNRMMHPSPCGCYGLSTDDKTG